MPIVEAVRAAWPKGVSSHGTPKAGGGKLGGGETIVDVWEVHLNGMAWGARGTRDGVAVRRLISQLLSTLSQHSYELAASIDASFKDSSRDVLYLKKRLDPAPTTVSRRALPCPPPSTALADAPFLAPSCRSRPSSSRCRSRTRTASGSSTRRRP